MVKPVASWIEKERFHGKAVRCLTVILRTRGCYWQRCLMCGFSYASDSRIGLEELKEQIDEAVRDKEFEVLKIFTSGSFFDAREVPPEFREYLYSLMRSMSVKKLIVESRPEFVKDEALKELASMPFEAEVGIGLETSNDFIRENCINKGFTFEDFVRAAEKLKDYGVRVKAYLLLKPPFLSEGEAIEDAIRSSMDVAEYADIISLNLMYIPSNTYVERLWQRNLYRPPWLWSAIEVLRQVRSEGIEIMCDPVAAGSERGPHNCRKCDRDVAMAIKEFSLSQNVADLDVSCDCVHIWQRVVELERYSRLPLVR
ncbi:archaeosine biosynthesis radical SAM protein RaSEA [Archaeoglobus veneficus]|uniref:Radical SAM core domain-containing protein n=1 Tax=Archaeoglobus veneficus (strain DSM 11195 / SNP6) TaxID=693661 RepID=F2KMK0_ARCVS|nr:archaeosine biosynthesis radical SAM protein RaSEA [Archaeoglobus veneficus]AEA47197.1 Conserved hypothetical protein CHP01210 [Archaeoglobus veneficus SNP6]